MQKSILDEEELKYNVTKAHRIANVTAWKAQVKVFEAAEKARRKAYGEYHGAEMALSRRPPLPSRSVPPLTPSARCSRSSSPPRPTFSAAARSTRSALSALARVTARPTPLTPTAPS